jgi:serine/threonine protein phosphatase PrpC
MEDAHISSLDIGDGVALFGVFDGHGGQLIHSLYTTQRHYFIRSLILILTIFSSFRR